jgi:hypothetical protein
MSSEANQAAAAKRMADEAAAAKRVADEAAAAKRVADEAAAAATSANWPTGGYYMLILLLLISMCIVLAISVDVSTICLVLHSYMIKYQYVHVMLMFYFWINIIEKLPRFLTATMLLKLFGLEEEEEGSDLPSLRVQTPLYRWESGYRLGDRLPDCRLLRGHSLGVAPPSSDSLSDDGNFIKCLSPLDRHL